MQIITIDQLNSWTVYCDDDDELARELPLETDLVANIPDPCAIVRQEYAYGTDDEITYDIEPELDRLAYQEWIDARSEEGIYGSDDADCLTELEGDSWAQVGPFTSWSIYYS